MQIWATSVWAVPPQLGGCCLLAFLQASAQRRGACGWLQCQARWSPYSRPFWLDSCCRQWSGISGTLPLRDDLPSRDWLIVFGCTHPFENSFGPCYFFLTGETGKLPAYFGRLPQTANAVTVATKQWLHAFGVLDGRVSLFVWDNSVRLDSLFIHWWQASANLT